MPNQIPTASNPRVGPLERVTCDGCSADITAAYLMCDRLDGRWCRECFGNCPCPPEQSCNGKDEGCPTLIVADVASAPTPDPAGAGGGLRFPAPADEAKKGGWTIDVAYLTRLNALARTKWDGQYGLEETEALLLSLDASEVVALGTEARTAETFGLGPKDDGPACKATPEATPKSSPDQTPVDPQMTVERAHVVSARLIPWEPGSLGGVDLTFESGLRVALPLSASEAAPSPEAGAGGDLGEQKGACLTAPGSCPSGPTAPRSSGFAAAIPSRDALHQLCWSEMPKYGLMSFEQLSEAVSEVMVADRHYKRALPLTECFIGHEVVSINFNSLNRIVTTFVQAALALGTEAEGQDAEGSLVHEGPAPEGATP